MLRHTFAVQKIRNGMALTVLQRLLKHSSLATTGRYTKPSAQDLIEGIDD